MQASCQTARLAHAGFTLLELLVVIVIIGILASALVVSVQSGYKQARQTNCKSNLRQFGVSLTIYRGEHENNLPNWISNLYPDYVDDRALYVCRADRNSGNATPVPADYLRSISDTSNFYSSQATWDNQKGTSAARNTAITCCSYCYEFSCASVGNWYNGVKLPSGTPISTMADYKRVQMTYGDGNNQINGSQMPYSASRIPIIRCCHHWRDQWVYGYANPTAKTGNQKTKLHIIINVAYAGNVFVGPPFWEGTIYPGESTAN